MLSWDHHCNIGYCVSLLVHSGLMYRYQYREKYREKSRIDLTHGRSLCDMYVSVNTVLEKEVMHIIAGVAYTEVRHAVATIHE